MLVFGRSAFAAIITAASSKSQPNTFAVAIVVVALGRTLYFLSFPVASYLVNAASTVIVSSDQQPNPSTISA